MNLSAMKNLTLMIILQIRQPSAGRDSDGKALRRPFRYNNFGWTVGGPVYFFNFGERGAR